MFQTKTKLNRCRDDSCRHCIPQILNFLVLLNQSRDGIIKGQYPVSEKDAITFAALQCQVQLGSHDEKKHKSGYIE